MQFWNIGAEDAVATVDLGDFERETPTMTWSPSSKSFCVTGDVPSDLSASKRGDVPLCIKVFDRESCKCVRTLELKVGVRVKEINWSDDDQHLCLRDKDDYFTVWDVGTGEKVFETKKDPADKDWERQWKLEFYHPSYPHLWREKDSEEKGSWSFLKKDAAKVRVLRHAIT